MVLFKVDFKRTCDKVKWDFLQYTLVHSWNERFSHINDVVRPNPSYNEKTWVSRFAFKKRLRDIRQSSILILI